MRATGCGYPDCIKRSFLLKEGSSYLVLYFKFSVQSGLPDAAFHFHVDKALQLDGVFHREGFHEFVDESVDCEAHGFAFGETSLHHVKDLLGADFGYTSFVLDRIVLPARCDGRVGVGPAIRVDQ